MDAHITFIFPITSYRLKKNPGIESNIQYSYPCLIHVKKNESTIYEFFLITSRNVHIRYAATDNQ